MPFENGFYTQVLYAGIARLNMGHFEDAIGYLEQQLATLEQLSSTTTLIDKVSELILKFLAS